MLVKDESVAKDQRIQELEARIALLLQQAERATELTATRDRQGTLRIQHLEAVLSETWGSKSWRWTRLLRIVRTAELALRKSIRRRLLPGPIGVRETIRSSGLFDERFYALSDEARRRGQEPIEHYIEFGEARGYPPSAGFDPMYY